MERTNVAEYLDDSQLLSKYEFYSYGHAAEILKHSFPKEWLELQYALHSFSISVSDILTGGGNESPIPQKFDDVLYPYGWREIRITGDLFVKMYPRKNVQRRGLFSETPIAEKCIKGFIDGHSIDFVKNKVAFDLEWNSKDQTFDRDLLAMRTYFDCGLIDVGVIVTRAEEMNDLFRTLTDAKGNKLIAKYGSSTTWIGKLLYRLNSRRNGGCPILAIGIKKGCVEGYGID